MMAFVFLGTFLGLVAGAVALISGAGLLAALGAYALTGSASTVGMALVSVAGGALRDQLAPAAA